MIIVGIDDTDISGSKGTNQLARAIVSEISSDWHCSRVVRHQLLSDPRVPCTSKNGSASILLSNPLENEPGEEAQLYLIHQIREIMKRWFIKGSDPGLCVTPVAQVSPKVVQFGYRCQFELVTQADALLIADEANIHLEGLGGTNGGLIGALAAVGLGCHGNDGRVIQIGNHAEEVTGPQTVTAIESLGVEVTDLDSDEAIHDGVVLIPKKLRPNLRQNRIVLYVQKTSGENGPTYSPVKFP